MFEKNPVLVLVLVVCAFLAGGVLDHVVFASGEPEIEMTIHGLFVNGKRVDLDKLKAKMPNIFGPDRDGKDKGGKKKPGDLGAGELGPAAMLQPNGSLCHCPCGDSCTCNPCHCHAAKETTYAVYRPDFAFLPVIGSAWAATQPTWMSETEFRKQFSKGGRGWAIPNPEDRCVFTSIGWGYDDDTSTPIVTQRGGPKSPELFGIESLVSILKDFKEAIFGSNGKPGLRDDIAGGLRDFYGTLRTGVIVAGGCIAGWMLWVGASQHRSSYELQRIADALIHRANQYQSPNKA